MIIQEAVSYCRAFYRCKRKEGEIALARPDSWEGSGCAVDLAAHIWPGEIKKVCPMSSGNGLLGSVWEVAPAELLENWRIVTRKTLAKETKECPLSSSETSTGV